MKVKKNIIFFEQTLKNPEILLKYFDIHFIKNIEELEFFDEENLKNTQGIFIKLKYLIDQKILKKFENLEFIASPTTGLNHIDINYCKEKDIKIICLKNEFNFLKNITPTAELTWGLILNAYRKLNYAINSVDNSYWNRDDFIGYDLKDKTIGILGYGRLGKIIHRYAKAFKMNVLINDVKEKIKKKKEYVPINILFESSDIVTVHVNYEINNNRFIDKKYLSKMKKNSLFVNTSRGELVNEKDLLSHLQVDSNLVALDVVADEHKIISNILLKSKNKYKNLIITPHIGGNTFESLIKTEQFTYEKIIKECNFSG